MNETDHARERAQEQFNEHIESCDDCNLALHGRGRECRQGAAITRRLRALGGKPAPRRAVSGTPRTALPHAPLDTAAPLPTKQHIEGPLTGQGVRDLNKVGPVKRYVGRY